MISFGQGTPWKLIAIVTLPLLAPEDTASDHTLNQLK
jgi:hypothetical protein